MEIDEDRSRLRNVFHTESSRSKHGSAGREVRQLPIASFDDERPHLVDHQPKQQKSTFFQNNLILKKDSRSARIYVRTTTTSNKSRGKRERSFNAWSPLRNIQTLLYSLLQSTKPQSWLWNTGGAGEHTRSDVTEV